MKIKYIILLLSVATVFDACNFSQKKNEHIRVLLITGGHDFDKEAFYSFVYSLSGISVTEVKHPDALSMFEPANRGSYDVVLLYDMPAKISEDEKQNFIDCLEKGKGLVVLHHAYCSYQRWDEYETIVGGRYHEKRWTDSEGVERPASSFKHDVQFSVKVADSQHPVTNGIADFEIIDETYKNGVVSPDVHVILTTDEITSTPSIAWTNQYGKSKVVTILLGHDNNAWSNTNFVKLVEQAVTWVNID